MPARRNGPVSSNVGRVAIRGAMPTVSGSSNSVARDTCHASRQSVSRIGCALLAPRAKFSWGCPSFGGQRTPGGGSTATFSGRSASCALLHCVKPSHGVVAYRNSGPSPTIRPQTSCPTPTSSGQPTASRGLPLKANVRPLHTHVCANQRRRRRSH